jgi:hypothetical protein
MSSFSLLNATIFDHDVDLTSQANKITLHPDVDAKEVPTFGSQGWMARIPGLKTMAADVAGFWDSTPDASIFAALGVPGRVVSVSPEGAETKTIYIFQAGKFTYDQGGDVGEPAPFAASWSGTRSPGGIVRGQMAKAKGNVAATGQLGSVLNLGAPSASAFVYAAFHIFTAATTITVQLQSDDNLGMSSPTTRGTLGPLTVAGGTWLARIAGPFAGEAYWRFNVSAITGTFSVAGAIAVQ